MRIRCVQNFAFKFQVVAEKTAKNDRRLLYFAGPCSLMFVYYTACCSGAHMEIFCSELQMYTTVLLSVTWG